MSNVTVNITIKASPRLWSPNQLGLMVSRQGPSHPLFNSQTHTCSRVRGQPCGLVGVGYLRLSTQGRQLLLGSSPGWSGAADLRTCCLEKICRILRLRASCGRTFQVPWQCFFKYPFIFSNPKHEKVQRGPYWRTHSAK